MYSHSKEYKVARPKAYAQIKIYNNGIGEIGDI